MVLRSLSLINWGRTLASNAICCRAETVPFELGAMSDFESVMSSKADVCQALPFKLIFFVLVDGWLLVAGSLVQSYGG
jgi:hypothetical protein